MGDHADDTAKAMSVDALLKALGELVSLTARR